ncbi:PREDICTED: uncharacterized protein LOC107335138 isoform X2 [Acropora digitifera]|uniref:uncharacterized protein LOC107335138 isoform X2 n=1 Tax=Acropora digitifera TaxID=70779 RepID=UPI00077B184E|nr:PREDICTED: uncharacterized protein LOC107335138 isoform X2 [Acropora digitifera]XP_015755601.1 PREDICTED: uncharacterized protein LOC107335138 isoform X2 [Acropora digitifera]
MNSTTAVVTELQLSVISDDAGNCWRDLGPRLGIAAAKIRNLDDEYSTNRDKANALLLKWKEGKGSSALVGNLADHFKEIGRTDIAEKLLGQDPTSSSSDCDSLTEKRNLKSEVAKLRLCMKDLEHELSTLRARGKELENGRQQKEEVAKLRIRQKDLEHEVDKLRIRQKDLEHEMSTLQAQHKELENGGQQKRECEGTDASRETEQEVRESRVREILEKCKEDLETYVTKPSMVQEVRHDNLPRTAVTVDVFKVLSEHLEKQYNTALDIAPEACQCSEDLRKCFHDFAYLALQAEHNEMNLKIKNLKKTLKKAPKDDKEEFKNLMRLQKLRKDLVMKLEKWRRLFSASSNRCFSDTTGKKPRPLHNKETHGKRPKSYPTIVEKEPLLLRNDEGD